MEAARQGTNLSLLFREREKKTSLVLHTSKSFRGRRFMFMVPFCFFCCKFRSCKIDLCLRLGDFPSSFGDLFDVVLINSSHLLIGSDRNLSLSFLPIPVIND